MRIPADAVIPKDKLTRYLLVPRPWDDKSQFLALGGFALDQPDDLESAIRSMAAGLDAIPDGTNDYGEFFRVEGELRGPNGVCLDVVLIWLQWKLDGTYHFVTLKPSKGPR
jgi:hypothetical protein